MDPQFYQEYYKLEREGWWFRARSSILESYMKTLSGRGSDIMILNVGAATGATSEMLSKYGTVTSVEYDKDCCEFMTEKTGMEVVHASLTDLPFEDNFFDIICAFDVIEHIENHELAAKEIHRVLKSNGNYFITVPAFQFLWSTHDVINHHYRRYTKNNLNILLQKAGLKKTTSSYFNFWLFFPIATIRTILNIIPRKKSIKSSGSDNEIFRSSKIINVIAFSIFKSERLLLRKGIKLPFGVSILSIGTKA